MSAIITEKFRLHNASQFVESFTETLIQLIICFWGRQLRSHQLQLVVQIVHPQLQVQLEDEFRAWNSMLGAKKISSSDVKRSIVRRNWSNGTVFDMYRHDYTSSNTATSGASDLYDSTFYFMTSDFRVYKVLDNNGGSAFFWFRTDI